MKRPFITWGSGSNGSDDPERAGLLAVGLNFAIYLPQRAYLPLDYSLIRLS
jgi:hypothetical protein